MPKINDELTIPESIPNNTNTTEPKTPTQKHISVMHTAAKIEFEKRKQRKERERRRRSLHNTDIIHNIIVFIAAVITAFVIISYTDIVAFINTIIFKFISENLVLIYGLIISIVVYKFVFGHHHRGLF